MTRSSPFILLASLLLMGCSSNGDTPTHPDNHTGGEFIYRRHDETFVQLDPMMSMKRDPYPWEEEARAFPKITKDFFRCKGCSFNPVHLIEKGKETIRYYDCGGHLKHSLPLRNDKEFIYPILLDLLNYIQTETNHQVIITSGHCCPDHNLYLDPSPSNQASKHMIGAEVDFYVFGMEEEPEKIVQLIMQYYRETAKYQGLKEYLEFKRFDKLKVPLATLPWYNKEVLIKVLNKKEGRDLDNNHPYPYVSLQVRHDWDLNASVQYSWDQAFRNFHRW